MGKFCSTYPHAGNMRGFDLERRFPEFGSNPHILDSGKGKLESSLIFSIYRLNSPALGAKF